MRDGFSNVMMLRRDELVEQSLHIGRNGEHGVMLGSKKLLVAHVGKELEQEVIEPTDI